MVREEILEIVAHTENTKGNFSIGVLADTTIINQQNSLLNTSFVEKQNQAHTFPLPVRENKYPIYFLGISRSARHLYCLDPTLIISPPVCLLIYSIFLLSVPINATISYNNRSKQLAWQYSVSHVNNNIFGFFNYLSFILWSIPFTSLTICYLHQRFIFFLLWINNKMIFRNVAKGIFTNIDYQ